MTYMRGPVYNDDDDTYYAVPEGLQHVTQKDSAGLLSLIPRLKPDDDNDDADDLLENFIELSDDYDESCRILALRFHLDEWDSYFSIQGWNDKRFQVGKNREYLVVTDDEADDLWDEDLEAYIDDCVLPGVPETTQGYFDRDAFKKDARMDGRAHSLNRYDGNEYDEEIDNTTYFIYRQN